MTNRALHRAAQAVALTSVVFLGTCERDHRQSAAAHAPEPILKDRYTLVGQKSFLSGYEPITARGDINVVVEIPAGTNQKWEVDETTGEMRWKFKHGGPRIVHYLAYPGNYGMVPRTLLAPENGGDGDPLDVMALGPSVPRGSVLQARVIGVLKIFDRGERDDKLIAVLPDSPPGTVSSLNQLDSSFAGITEIVETWFLNYKGPGKMRSEGFAGVDEARRVLEQAVAEYAGRGGAAVR